MSERQDVRETLQAVAQVLAICFAGAIIFALALGCAALWQAVNG